MDKLPGYPSVPLNALSSIQQPVLENQRLASANFADEVQGRHRELMTPPIGFQGNGSLTVLVVAFAKRLATDYDCLVLILFVRSEVCIPPSQFLGATRR